ncbi:MAG: hypothetical protein ACPG4T_22075, partial [Nannocystaceae bacterium]
MATQPKKAPKLCRQDLADTAKFSPSDPDSEPLENGLANAQTHLEADPHRASPLRDEDLLTKQMRNRVFGRLFNKRERLRIGRYDILEHLGHG